MPFSTKAFAAASRECGARLEGPGETYQVGVYVKTGPNPIFSGASTVAAMAGKVRTGYLVATDKRVAFYPASMMTNAPLDEPWFIDELAGVSVSDVVPPGMWGRFRYVSPSIEITFNFHKNEKANAERLLGLLGAA